MSLDDGIPWSVSSYLEKTPLEYNHRDWAYHDHLHLSAIESPEAESSRWSGRMEQAAKERPAVHYVTGSPQ